MTAEATYPVELIVNGRPVADRVPARMSLAHFLRERLGLTGTHLACEEGICGTCTVLVDGLSARACLMPSIQANGRSVTTIEGLSAGGLTELQESFVRHHALQCGFCTPGFVVLATELLAERDAGATFAREEIRTRLAANLCRCTGYTPIVDAVAAVLTPGERGE